MSICSIFACLGFANSSFQNGDVLSDGGDYDSAAYAKFQGRPHAEVKAELLKMHPGNFGARNVLGFRD